MQVDGEHDNAKRDHPEPQNGQEPENPPDDQQDTQREPNRGRTGHLEFSAIEPNKRQKSSPYSPSLSRTGISTHQLVMKPQNLKIFSILATISG